MSAIAGFVHCSRIWVADTDVEYLLQVVGTDNPSVVVTVLLANDLKLSCTVVNTVVSCIGSKMQNFDINL